MSFTRRTIEGNTKILFTSGDGLRALGTFLKNKLAGIKLTYPYTRIPSVINLGEIPGNQYRKYCNHMGYATQTYVRYGAAPRSRAEQMS